MQICQLNLILILCKDVQIYYFILFVTYEYKCFDLSPGRVSRSNRVRIYLRGYGRVTKLFMQTNFRWIRALQEKQMSCTMLLSIRSGVKYVSWGRFFTFLTLCFVFSCFFSSSFSKFFSSRIFSRGKDFKNRLLFT